MKTINRWFEKDRRYEKIAIPNSWKITTFEKSMKTKCNCASCGKELTFGECYISRHLHDDLGFGYGVCESCYFGN